MTMRLIRHLALALGIAVLTSCSTGNLHAVEAGATCAIGDYDKAVAILENKGLSTLEKVFALGPDLVACAKQAWAARVTAAVAAPTPAVDAGVPDAK